MGDGDMGGTRLVAGTTVGGYTIVRPIGSGAMGAVYRADDGGGTPVALKLLHRHLDDPAARERLRREARALQGLRHPAVARVLDAELDGPEAFIVTELVDGPTLEDEVDERGALDARDLFELADQLADALEAVHSTGVVHRDLTPSNVLIARHGPVLIDFGLAHNLGDARTTRTGFVMGTPGYLAPELLDGAQPGPDTDWWSWAAVLVFAGTGRPPFGVRPTEAVLRRSREGRVDLIGLPSRSARALGAALRAVPTQRWGPTEVARALRRSAEDIEAGVGVPVLLPGLDDTAVIPATADTEVVAVATERKGRSVTGRAVGLPVRPLGEDRYRAVGDVPPEPEDEVVVPTPQTGRRRVPRGRRREQVVGTVAAPGPVPPPGYAPPGSAPPGYAPPGYAVPGSAAPGSAPRGVPVVGAPPAAPYRSPVFPPRPVSIAAAALPIVVLGATRPGLAFAALAALVVLSRLVGVVVDDFHARRARRGAGGAEVPVALLKVPWQVVRAFFGALPALLVAGCAAVLVVIVGLWVFAPGRLIVLPQTSVEARSVGGMNEPVVDTWVLIIAAVAAVLIAWFGPAGAGTRSGARPLLRLVAPGPVGAVAVVILALWLTYLMASDWLAAAGVVDWWPLPGRPEIG